MLSLPPGNHGSRLHFHQVHALILATRSSRKEMMIRHISNAASILKRRTNFSEALTACVVCLVLLSSPGHAQTETSRTIQKEDTMTRSQATQRSSEQAADKDAIRR